MIETGVLILLAYIIGAALGFLGGIESTLHTLQGSSGTMDILRSIFRRASANCPPGFREDCIKPDETRCPYYQEGKCVKEDQY